MYEDLFGFWIVSITSNILFVIAASVYLYARRKRGAVPPTGNPVVRWAKNFVFVWILIGLLVLYVVTVGEGSQGYPLFATGNILVEFLLLVYAVRSGQASASTTPTSPAQPSPR